MNINPDLSIPLYQQIREHLIQQINDSVYPSGSRLPSERDLASNFGVSRVTVRQALNSLMQEGVIYSQTGKGHYVYKPKLDQELGFLTSFTEEMHQRGVVPSSQVIHAEIQLAMLEITEHLQITPGTEIVFLQRVRKADNEPISLETAYLPHSICPGIVERFDFSNDSLYKVLREEYACPLIWAKQRMQARLPTTVEQNLIGVNQGSPVLSITRITYSHNDHPVELVRSIHRGDQYELGIILR